MQDPLANARHLLDQLRQLLGALRAHEEHKATNARRVSDQLREVLEALHAQEVQERARHTQYMRQWRARKKT